MNNEFFMLRSEFVGAFVVALLMGAIAGADVHLIWLGEVGGHTFLAYLIAGASIIFGVHMTYFAWQKRRELRSLYGVHGQQPYGAREKYVRPDDAVRDIGGGGRDQQRPRNSTPLGGGARRTGIRDGSNDPGRLG